MSDNSSSNKNIDEQGTFIGEAHIPWKQCIDKINEWEQFRAALCDTKG